MQAIPGKKEIASGEALAMTYLADSCCHCESMTHRTQHDYLSRWTLLSLRAKRGNPFFACHCERSAATSLFSGHALREDCHVTPFLAMTTWLVIIASAARQSLSSQPLHTKVVVLNYNHSSLQHILFALVIQTFS
jgi:hypothetical protein